MSERYEISDQGDGTAIVIDTHTDQPVFTADGTRVYEAPTENAQWTADRLNRAEARKSAPAPEPEPVRPNLAALLHVMAHAEPTFSVPSDSDDYSTEWRTSEPTDADGTPIDYDGTPIAPAPGVRPVEKVDYPRLAGSAIGTIRVLLTHLNGITRWLDKADDMTPEFWMEYLREQVAEARDYAADATDRFATR